MKPNFHVLIVDSDREEAKWIGQTLATVALAVHISTDARAALDAFETLLPQLVFVDEGLERIDGTHISRLFAKLDQGRKTPIVLMSRSPRERRKRTKALSANGYALHLHKPFEAGAILDVVLELIPQAVSEGLAELHQAGAATPEPEYVGTPKDRRVR